MRSPYRWASLVLAVVAGACGDSGTQGPGGSGTPGTGGSAGSPTEVALPWPLTEFPELPDIAKDVPEERIQLGYLLFFDPTSAHSSPIWRSTTPTSRGDLN